MHRLGPTASPYTCCITRSCSGPVASASERLVQPAVRLVGGPVGAGAARRPRAPVAPPPPLAPSRSRRPPAQAPPPTGVGCGRPPPAQEAPRRGGGARHAAVQRRSGAQPPPWQRRRCVWTGRDGRAGRRTPWSTGSGGTTRGMPRGTGTATATATVTTPSHRLTLWISLRT